MNERCAFIKLYTTGNDLYGKHNCPIRFECEIFDNGVSIGECKKSKALNITPDELIMPSGYLSVKNTDYGRSEEKVQLDVALEKIYTLLSALKNNGFYIAGYSHQNFDIKILNEHFVRVLEKEPITFENDKILDVMKLSEVFVSVQEVGSYSMNCVYASLFGYFGYDDVFNSTEMEKCKKIFTELISKNRDNFKLDSFSSIVKFIEVNENISEMNFGKYKGKSLDFIYETDKKYCSWLLGSKILEQRPRLKEKIQKLMNEVE